VVDDFVRDELSDCESFNEAIKEVRRINFNRGEIKGKLERQFEMLTLIDRKQTNKYKIVKQDFETVLLFTFIPYSFLD
jgi:hypothetical protein